MSLRIPLALPCIALLLLGCSGDSDQSASRDETRAVMREIFDSMRVLLPMSAEAERFRSAENREAILAAMDSLADNTRALKSHVSDQDLRFSYLARNVAVDAAELRRAFRAARHERSAFLLGRITENCVVCHSRLPSPGDSPLAEEFVDGERLRDLPLETRTTLQLATRRFDSALASLEELIGSDEPAAMMMGPLTDYLVVSLRVKGEVERPARTLRAFLLRADLWEQLRSDVEGWIDSLSEVEPSLRGAPTVIAARELFQAGVRKSVLPGSRSGLVDFIASSALLERYTISTRIPGPELAEAYFLLGVIEARIGRNYWVSQAPFFLETAIRMAPKQHFARDAYALLEREVLAEYEGSEEEAPAEEDLRLLAALQALIGG